MEWLKKNLFFFGWGLVATILTVVAVFYVLSARQKDREVQETVEQKRKEFERIVKSDPQPNPTNIAAVKRDENQARQYVADVRRMFTSTQIPKTDTASFKKQLEDSLYQLTQQAADAHVSLPTNYLFSFAVQIKEVKFSPGSMELLLARLGEVKALCGVLFGARVHSLDSVRRVAVAPDDNGTAADILLQRHPRTNLTTGLVGQPYEVTFTGFSDKLGAVLDSLSKAPPFVEVKNITVEPAASQAAAPPPPEGGEAPPPIAPPPAEDTPQVFIPPPKPGGKTVGPQTILDQRLLRITMALEFLNAPAAK